MTPCEVVVAGSVILAFVRALCILLMNSFLTCPLDLGAFHIVNFQACWHTHAAHGHVCVCVCVCVLKLPPVVNEAGSIPDSTGSHPGQGIEKQTTGPSYVRTLTSTQWVSRPTQNIALISLFQTHVCTDSFQILMDVSATAGGNEVRGHMKGTSVLCFR